MLFKLLVASLSVASAFKVQQKPLPHKPAKLGLHLRGGADLAQISKYAAMFTSGFMLLPAGRDFLAPGTEIMPDDDKLIAKMFDDKSKDGYTFMWNAWGMNWIALSLLKLHALRSGNAELTKFAFFYDLVAIAVMAKGWVPEFAPFLALFGIETLALGKLTYG